MPKVAVRRGTFWPCRRRNSRSWRDPALGRDLQARYGIDYRVVALDLMSDDVLSPVRKATDDLDVGLVISNAGGPLPGEFLRQSREVLFGQVRLDVTAPLELIHHFAPSLAARGRGGLILVSAMGATGGLVANRPALLSGWINRLVHRTLPSALTTRLARSMVEQGVAALARAQGTGLEADNGTNRCYQTQQVRCSRGMGTSMSQVPERTG